MQGNKDIGYTRGYIPLDGSTGTQPRVKQSIGIYCVYAVDIDIRIINAVRPINVGFAQQYNIQIYGYFITSYADNFTNVEIQEQENKDQENMNQENMNQENMNQENMDQENMDQENMERELLNALETLLARQHHG